MGKASSFEFGSTPELKRKDTRLSCLLRLRIPKLPSHQGKCCNGHCYLMAKFSWSRLITFPFGAGIILNIVAETLTFDNWHCCPQQSKC